MSQNINKLIIRHLQYLEQAKQLTCQVLHLSSAEDIDPVFREIENRDRLVQIIRQAQSQIEEAIENLTPDKITRGFVQVVKSWQADTDFWAEKVNEMDMQVVANLEIAKRKTSNEIAQVFSNKSKIKGYNLNDLKK
ncbi:MAG: hypothetical protein HN509_00200 [Halobacteriovoraceae bacterium]|jgi:hypothetical protein|nr:hypothetical protein [Halobacteriovoraceae bacterium]MBT5095111.1 hypothetical protein [Halobacteriovoraceae bacterium]